METVRPDRPTNHGQIMWGVLIVAAGVLLLIERTGLADIRLTSQIWPILPLGLGLLRLIDPPMLNGRHSRRSAAWLLFLGCWGLLNEFHVRGLDYHNSWPLLVIFFGVTLVFTPPRKERAAGTPVWRSGEAPVCRRVDKQGS
jgi:hypothetical protein